MFEDSFVWLSCWIHNNVSKLLGFWMRCPTCGFHWGKHDSKCHRWDEREVSDRELLVILRCFYRATDGVRPNIIVDALKKENIIGGVSPAINGGILFRLSPYHSHVALTQYGRAMWLDSEKEGLFLGESV